MMKTLVTGATGYLGGENRTFEALLTTLKYQTNSQARFVKVPLKLIEYGYSLVTPSFKNRLFPHLPPFYVLQRMAQDLPFSSEKAIEELGYTICPFEFGINNTVAHFRALYTSSIHLSQQSFTLHNHEKSHHVQP